MLNEHNITGWDRDLIVANLGLFKDKANSPKVSPSFNSPILVFFSKNSNSVWPTLFSDS